MDETNDDCEDQIIANRIMKTEILRMENNMFNKYPRDLLQRFAAVKDEQMNENDDDDESEEIELNLGLSLGGRFGVDKKITSNELIRSSSVASSLFIRATIDDDRAGSISLFPACGFQNNLPRTASLPTETEEEWRKRKELQGLKRMEAKRRRSEKQKCSSFSKSLKQEDGGQYMSAAPRGPTRIGVPVVVVQPVGLLGRRNSTQQGLFDSLLLKWKGNFIEGGSGGSIGGELQGFDSFVQADVQGSIESQGGSSSGISDLESKPVQGTSSGGEPISPISIQSRQERTNQDITSSSKRPDLRETGASAMGEMPCVFTKGDGPNGRRVDGILYKYGKGEEVRIMCVCHGKFLSPAEFVKHAGGGDVPHPLRHIVIKSASSSFL